MKNDKIKEPGAPGMTKMIDFKTFHEMTRAEFRPEDPPHREPDFVSASGSVYWDAGTGVYRSSDHWAGLNGCKNQASCVWSILDAVRPGVWLTGYCDYEDFTRRVWAPTMYPVNDRGRQIARDVHAGEGAYVENLFLPAALPVWAKLNMRGSRFVDPKAQRLFSRDPNARRVVTADAGVIAQILAGADMVGFGRTLT